MSSTVSFLSQAEWDGFGRYAETPPDRQTLERFFFLDDADRELIDEHRRAPPVRGSRVVTAWTIHFSVRPAHPVLTALS